jgi:hypothetical protein
MTGTRSEPTVTLDDSDAEGLWAAWAPPGEEDILAREAFERTLRFATGIEDDGLYFRPGGWTVDLPATAARVACIAAILAAGFQIAGLEDLDREVIIAAASLVASMDVRPVRPGCQERRLAKRLRQKDLEGVPISAAEAHRALPKRGRKEVSHDEIADALDRLVDAGMADRNGDDEWLLRREGNRGLDSTAPNERPRLTYEVTSQVRVRSPFVALPVQAGQEPGTDELGFK